MSLDTKTFNAFVKLLYDRCGIALGEGKETLVAARIGKRLRALGLDTPKDYLEYLQHNNDEFTEFLNVMTTNTTHFFREIDHFHFMARIVQDMVDQGANKIRIWCAASSSGEEPYTIAMTFLENSKNFRGDCRILATDIDTNILRMARRGEYSEEKMKGVDQSLRTKYFTSTGVGATRVYRAGDALAGMLSFSQLNLAKPPFPMKGPFDIIFCRNVMIYFDSPTKQALAKRYHDALEVGGYLFIGLSETLSGIQGDFQQVSPSIYRRVK